MQRYRHQEFIRFLNAVEAAVPAGKLIHAIMDNYAAHKHPKVMAWLERHLCCTGDGRLDAELRGFSLTRAIASQVPDIAGQIDAGRERELSAELCRRTGIKAKGIIASMAVFEKRVLMTTMPVPGPGSHLIPT